MTLFIQESVTTKQLTIENFVEEPRGYVWINEILNMEIPNTKLIFLACKDFADSNARKKNQELFCQNILNKISLDKQNCNETSEAKQ